MRSLPRPHDPCRLLLLVLGSITHTYSPITHSLTTLLTHSYSLTHSYWLTYLRTYLLRDCDFSSMHELDGDNGLLQHGGLTAKRDIVQFVPFREYAAKGSLTPSLTGSLLLTHSLTHSLLLTHSLTLTHPLTHSYSLTHLQVLLN